MSQRHRGGLALFLAVLGWLLLTGTAQAEGTVYFGGYGIDHPWCGGALLPCASYEHARALACTYSEHTQDTYHVNHLLWGYQSSCDMAGGAGREPRVLGRYDWGALLLSLLMPTVVCFGLSMALVTRYYRRRERRGQPVHT